MGLLRFEASIEEGGAERGLGLGAVPSEKLVRPRGSSRLLPNKWFLDGSTYVKPVSVTAGGAGIPKGGCFLGKGGRVEPQRIGWERDALVRGRQRFSLSGFTNSCFFAVE